MDSDSSFDSSDSEYDKNESEEEEDNSKPRESVAALLEPENIDGQPTALEEVVEAAKNVPTPELRREETDEVKVKLLKSLNDGDLSNDVAKVKRKKKKRC